MAEAILGAEKFCSGCGVVRPREEFSRQSKAKDGLQSACKPCNAAYRDATRESRRTSDRARYAANPGRQKAHAAKRRERLGKERIAELNAAYVAKNCDELREKNRAYKAAARDRWREYCRLYYEANKDAFRAARRKYIAENYPSVLESSRRRHALKRNAVPAWADRAAILAVYDRAARLSQETGIAHHVDHIVPLQSKIVCGLHVAANLQVITASENCRKGNRWWPDMP